MMSILFLLFDDRLNGNPRISSVKFKMIWGPQNLRAPAIWPEWPPSERSCIHLFLLSFLLLTSFSSSSFSSLYLIIFLLLLLFFFLFLYLLPYFSVYTTHLI